MSSYPSSDSSSSDGYNSVLPYSGMLECHDQRHRTHILSNVWRSCDRSSESMDSKPKSKFLLRQSGPIDFDGRNEMIHSRVQETR